ncbi:hypothetical protein IW262DRAFT_1333939 [Armillaria fumosa]|nr:hypothetical protein IW262DRAFT_1333939 [Armillaria fumosa]
MPFSVTVIPRDDSATDNLVEPPYGDIFSVFESLTIPFHQLCMTALDSVSVRTTPACRRIVESICSSRLSRKGTPRGKERPGILCPPPPEGENQLGPWFYLMGTFDGHDESSLPEVYREFAVIVATGPPKDSDKDKFCIRTVPEWHTSRARRRPKSVTAFFRKLFYDRNYLKNVAQALRDDEVKYRRQKQKDYAASRRTANTNIQRLEERMKSIRLDDSTNSVKGHTSKNHTSGRSSWQKKRVPSTCSKRSARVLL